MKHVLFRIWLLWGACTFIIQYFFGFNQWTRLFEVVAVSTPQVEAFVLGITALGWQQLPFILLPFFTRRAVLLAVKKIGSFLLYILLVVHWRKFISTALLIPGQVTANGVRRVRNWHEIQSSLLLRGWFLYFYTASMLTLGTFVFSEVFLALVYGTLQLPPIVVQYQAQVLTFVGAYIAASVTQAILLKLWSLVTKLPVWGLLAGALYHVLPHRQRNYLYVQKHTWFRRTVRTRRLVRRTIRRVCTPRHAMLATFFIWLLMVPL